jgi:mono/diheme cytochrome c family protein
MRRSIRAVLLFGAAISLATSIFAQTNGDLGKSEYEARCAVCHGTTGKGDGPYVSMLRIESMPDLTTLQTRNSGVYPFERVYETIDGRRAIKAHGPSDMPIWGQRYLDEAKNTYHEYPDAPYLPAYYVRARVLALTEYLSRIQAQ